MRNTKKDHKTEQRKEMSVSYCMEPKCKFYGKRAAQGVCYSNNSPTADKYLKLVCKEGEDFLKSVKACNDRKKRKDYVKILEGYVVTTWMNGIFTLDELIYLRAENARLRLKLSKWK